MFAAILISFKAVAGLFVGYVLVAGAGFGLGYAFRGSVHSALAQAGAVASGVAQKAAGAVDSAASTVDKTAKKV